MARSGPRGPQWTYYGEGMLTFHLTSGQSIEVKVATFKHRYHPEEGDQYEWTPDGADTLPVIPANDLIAAIEHHQKPRPPLREGEAEAGKERRSYGESILAGQGEPHDR